MTVAELHPVPIRFVNIGDQFGESGAPDALIEKFGLTAATRRRRPRGPLMRGQGRHDRAPRQSVRCRFVELTA